MVELKLFQNPRQFPEYTNSITQIGTTKQVTPLNINSQGGEILSQNFPELHTANYLSLKIDGQLLYAWIDSIEHYSGDKRYKIIYSVDPFRTYINRVTLGTQFIKRDPIANNKFDEMLKSENPLEVTINKIQMNNDASKNNYRTLVVVSKLAVAYQGNPVSSITPAQPVPYFFNLYDYDTQNWTQHTPLKEFMNAVQGSSKAVNIVSMYTIPLIEDGGDFVPTQLPLDTDPPNTPTNIFYNFRLPYGTTNHFRKIKKINPLPESYKKTQFRNQLIIGEGAVLNIPKELSFKTNLYLKQDIDLYTGSSNWSLCLLVNGEYQLTGHSTRTTGLSPIPLAYNEEQQLLAINQTNNRASMLSDVGNLAISGFGLGASLMTGNLIGAGLSGAKIIGTFVDSQNRKSALEDSLHNSQEQALFTGSALTLDYTNKVYQIITRENPTNSTNINSLYGYPQDKHKALSIPSPSGFVQTQECAVSGPIPKWAIEEINQIFDNGLRVVQ